MLGDVFRVDSYTLTHIFKNSGQVINAALFIYRVAQKSKPPPTQTACKR